MTNVNLCCWRLSRIILASSKSKNWVIGTSAFIRNYGSEGLLQGKHAAWTSSAFGKPLHPGNKPPERMYATKPDTGSEASDSKEHNSNNNDMGTTKDVKRLTSKERLKIITTQYGAFGMAFHITISLASLGLFYFLVYSGVDFALLMDRFGMANSAIATGTSTFIVAYAVHKVFAPVRIGITFVSVPILVRYLRKVGLFKKK